MRRAVLELFTAPELIKWPLPAQAEWKSNEVFADADGGSDRMEDLHKRVVQHVSIIL